MDRLIYTAASGARALMQRQDGLTHNLANANTPGFRADEVFRRDGDGALDVVTRRHEDRVGEDLLEADHVLGLRQPPFE